MANNSQDRSISELRKEYTLAGLDENSMERNPFQLFARWLDEAIKSRLPEPTAMTLSTASKEAIPSARIVLLKRFDNTGFVFYTNYKSRKGIELSENPAAALTFHWSQLERQVRVVGSAKRVSRRNSESYFHSRPIGSQIGALASRQSEIIAGRSLLEAEARRLEKEYRGKEIPLPPSWGGFKIVPSEIEFWQGRPNRLHDRLRYTLGRNGKWKLDRLSP